MFYLLLDILIYNYTPYLPYFFLLNLNNKSYAYNLSLALLIDFLIIHMFPLNVIWLTILYFSQKYIFKFNFHNKMIYFLFYLGIIIFYYLVNALIFTHITLLDLLNVIIINGAMIIVSYKKEKLNIK